MAILSVVLQNRIQILERIGFPQDNHNAICNFMETIISEDGETMYITRNVWQEFDDSLNVIWM